MDKKSKVTLLGQEVDLAKVTKGPPPIIFAVQPDAYVTVETPEELKIWENDFLMSLGGSSTDQKLVERMIANSPRAMGYTYSCSGCRRDDCDQVPC